MRITNNMMMRTYGGNLMSNLSDMDKTGQKIASGRNFQKASEDPLTALRALQVRKSIREMDQYMKNIDYAESWLSQTETGVSAVKTCIDEALLLLVQGRNDTLTGGEVAYKFDSEGNLMYDDEGDPIYETYGDRNIIATNIRGIQEQLLKNLNTQINGKYIFGGANTKQAPFAVYSNPDNPDDEQNGHLIYNTQDIVDMEDISELENDKVWYDLGMGFRLDEDDDLVDPNSAFDMYTPGTDLIGVGEDNLYNLLGKIADAFESNNMDLIDGILGASDADADPENDGVGLFKKLEIAQQKVLIQLTNVGERSKFVEYLKNRTDSNLYEAETYQNKLEAIKYEEEIMNYKMQQMVYSACLQTGTYVLQQSLMDYLR